MDDDRTVQMPKARADWSRYSLMGQTHHPLIIIIYVFVEIRFEFLYIDNNPNAKGRLLGLTQKHVRKRARGIVWPSAICHSNGIEVQSFFSGF